MRNAIDDKADVYLAFLDYRNTPTEAMHTSPAQRMFARRTRTLLPMLPVLLQTEPAAQREAPGQLNMTRLTDGTDANYVQHLSTTTMLVGTLNNKNLTTHVQTTRMHN